MYKAGLAGIALAIIIPSLALAPEAEARNTFRPAAHAGVVTEGHVARLKAVLKLTPDQERLWPPVEAARRKTGIGNDSDLINAALAVIAAPDDFGPWFAAQAGRLPRDFELEL